MCDEDIKGVVQRLWPKIKEQTEPLPSAVPVRSMPSWKRWLVAAVIGGALVAGGFLFHRSNSISGTAKPDMVLLHLKEAVNTGNVRDTVFLADSSMVVLEPGAKLYFEDSFKTAKREVILEGNAFFKVTKNPLSPFYVHSNNIVTQVLGTSFFVKTFGSEDVEVSVRTGKVAVYEDEKAIEKEGRNEESNGVILKPNQKVIYNRLAHHFRTTLVDAPLPLLKVNKTEETITEVNSVFEEAPVAKVLSRLEKAYHIDIDMENEAMANCLFSGDIKGQNLYEQLDIICQAVQATYEVRGTRILVKGTGCR